MKQNILNTNNSKPLNNGHAAAMFICLPSFRTISLRRRPLSAFRF
ncbi:hypothetical protein [Pedobacter alpinus]|uniref:Uncharacterized protein n=1 Tax=Pedobacter alpinus TaxID=1590643 RepID=A0ABW5TPC8_9SPHI